MDESLWQTLEGGYRLPYDPRPAIARLGRGDTSAWEELWNELHHQGDVGLASYAAVPELVRLHRERDVPDWNTYAIVGCIEACRGKRQNPPLPAWLEADYWAAWDEVVTLACRDLPRAVHETTVRSIVGAVLLAKGVNPLGELILNFSTDELVEMIAQYQVRQ